MVKVEFQHTDVELWQAYQASTYAVERRRLHVLALLAVRWSSFVDEAD